MAITRLLGQLLDSTSDYSFANVTVSGNITASKLTATNIVGTLATAAQPTITSVGSLTGLIVSGDTTVTGNLVVQGGTTTIGSNNYTVYDSIIDLHTYANLAPLTADDGRDVGLKFHYYKGSDKHAFLGWANDSGSLEYYSTGNDTDGVFTGTAYGNIKAASFISTATTGIAPFTVASTTTVTNLAAATAGTVTTAAQPAITSVGTLTSLAVTGLVTAGSIRTDSYFYANGTAYYNTGPAGAAGASGAAGANGATGATGVFSGTTTQQIITSNTTTSTSNITGALIVGGGIGISGNINFSGNLYQNGVLFTGGSSGGNAGTLVTVDNFTGDGAQTTFTLSATPSNSAYVLINIDGASQLRSSFSVSSNSLTFTEAPPLSSIIDVTTIAQGNISGSMATKIITTNTAVSTSSITGALQVAGGAGIGGDVFIGSASTTAGLTVSGSAVFTGSGKQEAVKLTNTAEVAYLPASVAPASTQTFYVGLGAVQYYVTAATTNWVVNIAFSATVTMNTAMAVGDVITVAMMVTQSGTPYYCTAVQIDGVTTNVTTRWQGGTAPSAGNASGIDSYSFSVIKTASATYTVLSSQTKFT